MAKIVWNTEFEHLTHRLRNLPEEVAEAATEIVTDTAKYGGDLMYRLVNRVDTEFMKGSVGNSEARRDGDTVSAEFGWGIDGAETAPYFIYQERGFTHYRSGKKIPPMHALLGSFMSAREYFKMRIKNMFG